MLAQTSYFLPDEQACLDFGRRLAMVCPVPCIILLQGQLGMGKTTLTRGFLRALGITSTVRSPTFTLVEAYQAKECHVYHFDLYRIEDIAELEHIGWRDYFTAHSICLLEWPERAQDALGQADLLCQFSLHSTGRLLNLYAKSTEGSRILRELSKQ